MSDMLYIAGVLGSLIIVGFLAYPIACVIEAVSRERKKLRQVREHQDEARDRNRTRNYLHPYDTPERGKMSSAGDE